MSATASRRGREAFALGLAFGVAAGAIFGANADEPKIVPITRLPDSTALSATRQEIETVKSARDPALQPKTELPRFTVPELSTSGPAPMTPTKPTEPEKKNPNWLVDAMQPPRNGTRLRGREWSGDEDERDATLGRSPFGQDAAGVLDGIAARRGTNPRVNVEPTDTARRSSKVPVPTNPVANPLTPYLGAWMTPQDYSLLKPGPEIASLAAPNENRAPGPMAGLPSWPTGAVAGVFGATNVNPAAPVGTRGQSSPTNATRFPAEKPRENPFLQIVTAPLPPPIVTPPRNASVPRPSTSGVTPIATATAGEIPLHANADLAPGSPPAPASIERARDSSKSTLPDFVKPLQDEKYFRQLKRF